MKQGQQEQKTKLSGVNGLRMWDEDERGISVSVLRESRALWEFVGKERRS